MKDSVIPDYGSRVREIRYVKGRLYGVDLLRVSAEFDLLEKMEAESYAD